ncbi:MAG: type I 3-dehydroquinate dehydratase, partial [Acidobacteria bacterium]
MVTPLLCVTVAAKTIEELRRQRDEAAAVADLVELRLDALDRPDVVGALSGRRTAVIVTCRPSWEGGGFEGEETARLALLAAAMDRGAEFVDVEWRAECGPLVARLGGKRVVLSSHDFDGVPPDLAQRYRAMRSTGAEVVKLAVTPRRLAETADLCSIAGGAGGRERVSVVGMGPAGLASRVLPARFGSCWTYAGEQVAPGQLPASRLLHEFRFRSLTAATALYGVVGRPIGHSISPILHNAAFGARGVDAVFLPLEAADADDFVVFARAIGLSGASVTAPFKVDLLGRVAAADGLARQAGALNTLRMSGGGWEGRNTDVPGFLAPLEGKVRLEGARVSVLGAGGAARAVALAAAGRGGRVKVHARRPEAAREVAVLCGGEVGAPVPAAGEWDVLVNATPVGTYTEGGGR